MESDNAHTGKGIRRFAGIYPVIYQTWGELIFNANALLMHYFFPVIQGND